MVSRVMMRKLRRDLMQRKISLIVLLLIVTIGVGCFIGMAAVYRDLDNSRYRYYTSCRLVDFTIDLKRVPQQVISELTNLPNVRLVQGRVSMPVQIDLPGRDEPITGTALSIPAGRPPALNALYLRTGAWLSDINKKEVILDQNFAPANNLTPGSRLKVILFDKQHEFLVAGSAMSPEFVIIMPPFGGFAPDPERYGILYLEQTFMQEHCDLDGAFNQIIGTVYDNSRTTLTNTLLLIEDQLAPYGVVAATPYWEQASVNYLNDELSGLKISATMVPTIFLGVSALVLNVLIGRMIKQQRPIIGTLRSLGYTTGSIIWHYLGYGLLIGMAGGLTGILFGWWLQNQMLALYSTFYEMPETTAHLYPDIFIAGLCISVAAAALGTIKGARYAAKLHPAEAMRPPPPEKGGKALPERIGWFWKKLSFRWKMILRDIFRNPFRSSVSVCSSIISAALIFSTFSQLDALNFMMSYEFDEIAHQDYSISLREPLGERAQLELGSLPGVSASEPQLLVACDLSRGSLKKRVGIIGLPQNNQLYTPIDYAGNKIPIPKKGIILTRKLAEILNVKAGDTLKMRPLIARRTSVTVPVMGIADTFFGLTAYVDIDYLSQLLGEEKTANVILCNLAKNTSEQSFMKELKKRPYIVGVGQRSRLFTQLNETFGQNMGVMMTIMVLFAGLIAFGSVLNTALVSVSERQRSIGTFRVLGYTNRQIATIFSGESLLLNGFGIPLGLLGGIGLAYWLSQAYNTEMYRFPMVITFSSLALSALLTFLFIILAQIIVYQIIRSLKWLDVLKIQE